MTNPKIQKLPLESLTPYWRNPRDGSASVGAVKASIEAFTQQVPIIVDNQMVIIAGHSTYKALKQLDEKFAFVVVSGMTPEQAKAYRIVDNKTAEIATWHRELLAAELSAMGEGIEAVRPFFDPVDLGSLLGQPVPPAIETAAPFSAPVGTESVIAIPCPHCGETNKIGRAQFA